MITTKFKEIRHLYNIWYDKIKYRIIQLWILELHLHIKFDILINKKTQITVNKQTNKNKGFDVFVKNWVHKKNSVIYSHVFKQFLKNSKEIQI